MLFVRSGSLKLFGAGHLGNAAVCCTAQAAPDGSKQWLKRLPVAKARPDESQAWIGDKETKNSEKGHVGHALQRLSSVSFGFLCLLPNL